MSEHLEVRLDDSTFECGGRVTGVAAWRLDREPRRLTLSLRYETEGRGDTDRKDAVVEELGRELSGSRRFEMVVPVQGPVSYDGDLIRVFWVVRLNVDRALQRDPHVEESMVVVPLGALTA